MSKDEIILYNTGDSEIEVEFQAVNGTVWSTQAQIANLFSTAPQAITQLIRLTYQDVDINEEATCKKLSQVQIDESKRIVKVTNEQRKVNKDD